MQKAINSIYGVFVSKCVCVCVSVCLCFVFCVCPSLSLRPTYFVFLFFFLQSPEDQSVAFTNIKLNNKNKKVKQIPSKCLPVVCDSTLMKTDQLLFFFLHLFLTFLHVPLALTCLFCFLEYALLLRSSLL